MIGLRMGRDAADRLLPMHLEVGADDTIVHVGPTLARIAGRDLKGEGIATVLRFARPYAAPEGASFAALAGRALQVDLRRPDDDLPLRAVLVELPGGGALLDLAPGVRLSRVVRDHGLDATDFSPVDASVELLFVLEAQALVRAALAASPPAAAEAREAPDAPTPPVAETTALLRIDGPGLAAMCAGDQVRPLLREEDRIVACAPDSLLALLTGEADTEALAAITERVRTAFGDLAQRGAIAVHAWPIDAPPPDIAGEPAPAANGATPGREPISANPAEAARAATTGDRDAPVDAAAQAAADGASESGPPDGSSRPARRMARDDGADIDLDAIAALVGRSDRRLAEPWSATTPPADQTVG